MGYYQGDYYRGDYYQGGIPIVAGAFKLLPKALGLAKKAGKGIVAGTKKLLAKPGVKKAAGAVSIGTGIAVSIPPRKSADETKSELRELSDKTFGGRVPGAPRRRMNVTNVKALRRAIRRARGFAKLARKVLTFPISKPPAGRALFKKKGR